MALSAKASKALEQAKHALSVLYATDYFSEEEWIKLDGLIHKGTYVWTQGPAPIHLLDGSPLLMSANDRNMMTTTEIQVQEPFDLNAPNKLPSQSTPPYTPTADDSATINNSMSDSGLLVERMSAAAPHAQSTTPKQLTASPARSMAQMSSQDSTPKSPDPLTKANLSTVPQSKPNIEELSRQFREKHGREPRAINEIYQPNNSEHWSIPNIRSMSRASGKTARSSAAPSISLSIKGTAPSPQLNVPVDSILIAQKGYESQSALKISVKPGDNIQYCKYVSGQMHIGLNLRTRERGQVSEELFKNKDGAFTDALFNLPAEKAKGSKRTRNTSMSSADLRAGIDNLVEHNAAEWNQVSDDELESVMSRQLRPDMMKAVVAGVSQVFEEKFQKYISDRETNTWDAPQPRGHRRPVSTQDPPSDSSRKPKTTTCWFWEKKTCRFTDEECFDLHAFAEAVPVLKNGRPTWGDLASSMHAAPAASGSALSEVGNGARTQTCFFYAHGKCDKPDGVCKYLHTFEGSEGIASRPGSHWKKWESKAYTSSDWKADSADSWDTVPAENHNSSWRNQSEVSPEPESQSRTNLFDLLEDESSETQTVHSSGSKIYKPPHIKAMEEQAQAQEIDQTSTPAEIQAEAQTQPAAILEEEEQVDLSAYW